MKRSISAALLLACVAACSTVVESRAQTPLRLTMLDPDGVVIDGYGNVPYLEAVGHYIGIDLDYRNTDDTIQPTLFVASRGAVDETGCLSINPAFVAPDRLASPSVCGLVAVEGQPGCAMYRFTDPAYGRGFVVVSDVSLEWHLPFSDQARVGDCIVDVVIAAIGRDRFTPHGWRVLTDYVGSRRVSDQ